MTTLKQIQCWMSRVLRTALAPSVATTVAVTICGHRDEGNAIAPLNAISHIAWGDVAAKQEDASVRYTATGIALNIAAITSWSAVYELAFGRVARKNSLPAAMLGGISVAALAYVIDYYVVPKRLTPGFEKRLTPRSMFIVYSSLALSLPLASLLERDSAADGSGAID